MTLQQHEQKKIGGNSGLKPETVLRLSGWPAIYSNRFFFFYLRGLCCCAFSHAGTASLTSSLHLLYCNALSNRLNAATPSFICINRINSSYLMACSLTRQSKNGCCKLSVFAGCQPYVSCKVFLFP